MSNSAPDGTPASLRSADPPLRTESKPSWRKASTSQATPKIGWDTTWDRSRARPAAKFRDKKSRLPPPPKCPLAITRLRAAQAPIISSRLKFREEVVMPPAVVTPQPIRASLPRKECSNLILTFARVLYVNGESTQQTLNAAERISNCLGFRATVFPHWGELKAQAEDSNGQSISAIE